MLSTIFTPDKRRWQVEYLPYKDAVVVVRVWNAFTWALVHGEGKTLPEPEYNAIRGVLS
jgi:hypothetical protein